MWKAVLLTCLLLVSALPQCTLGLKEDQKDALLKIGLALGVTIADQNDPCADSLEQIVCVNDTVTELHWGAVSASGTLPTELSVLVNLTFLDLSKNSITGSIPEVLGSLTALQRLNLASNQLSGSLPSTLQAWRAMIMLDLSDNKLTGSVPSWIASPAVTQLRLQQNSFTGSIPTFTNSPSLLDLSDTGISGTIPTSLFAYPSLVDLHLSNTALTGSLPTTMSATKLHTVIIANAQLSGPIPKSLASLATLQHLELPDNQLSGTIPDIFLSLPQLASLNVSGNTQLTGAVPLSIRNTSLTHVDFSDTSLNLCKTKFPGTSPFQAAAVCQIGGLSTCGCSLVWTSCTGGTHCSAADCKGPKPYSSFYCTERGWVSDTNVELQNGDNLTIYGPTIVKGLVSTTGTVIFMGLDAQLTVNTADLQFAHVILSAEDLTRIVKDGVHNNVVLEGVGVASVDMDTEYAASCYQARSSIEITSIGRSSSGAKIYRASLNYSGFWSACALWTIPVHGVIHALLLAGGIGFIVWTYCKPSRH